MGYSSNLKKIRKFSNKEIQPLVEELKQETDEGKIFTLSENILKLVEIHFNMKRKDNKLYNRYRNQVDELLTRKIFTLDLVKPKDKNSKIETVSKKPLNFIYVLVAVETDKVNTLYRILKQNIMPSWFETKKDENGELIRLPKLNMQSSLVKTNKEKIISHLKSVYEIVSENNLLDILDKEKLLEYKDLVDKKLSEMLLIKNETFEQSFYRYKFEALKDNIKDISTIREYIDYAYKPLEEFIKELPSGE